MILFNNVDLVGLLGTVDGENSLKIRDILGRGPIRKEITSQVIKGRPGSHPQSSRVPDRILDIKIVILSEDLADLRSKVDTLNGVLNINDTVPIVFNDELDKTYYGMVSDSTDWNEIREHGVGTIRIICHDPFKYETNEQSIVLPATMNNDGTEDTPPVFELEFLQPSTHIEIINDDKRVRLGTPVAIEQTPIDREELILHDTMTSTTGWTVATSVENGYVTGEMTADTEKGFYPSLYGEEVLPSMWQGPSLVRSIGESLQDFRIDIHIRQMNVNYETGMIEVYLLDVNDNVVCKVGFEDIWTNRKENQFKFQAGALGNDFDYYAKALDPWGWNNFDGILRIERVGNVWKPYVAKFAANGEHVWRHSTFRYTDIENLYTTPVTQVQVAIRKYPETVETDQSIKEIKIYKINEPATEEEIPYLFYTGDIVTVENKNQKVLLNGEPYNVADFSTEFFDLKKGQNTIEVDPPDIATVTMKYKRRYA